MCSPIPLPLQLRRADGRNDPTRVEPAGTSPRAMDRPLLARPSLVGRSPRRDGIQARGNAQERRRRYAAFHSENFRVKRLKLYEREARNIDETSTKLEIFSLRAIELFRAAKKEGEIIKLKRELSTTNLTVPNQPSRISHGIGRDDGRRFESPGRVSH
jgi:hypothetical protein